jgi:heptosyltransferase II
VSPEVTRVVVLAPNWLGDAVMALPALRDVRAHFARATLAVAARASVARLFDCVPGVDEIVVLAPRRPVASAASRTEDSGWLAEGAFECAILFPNSFHAAWLVWRAGVAERWGYRSDLRGSLLTRAVPKPPKGLHCGAYYQHLVRELGIDTGPLTPRLRVPAAGRVAARRMLEEHGWVEGATLVALAPGAAYGHAKRWPPERFAELIRLIWDEFGAACVLLGRPDDRHAGEAILAALERSAAGRAPARVIDLIGRTDLLLLIGVLSHCGALVANDSGALHLAAAMGLPVSAIYGPTDERYTTPLTAREGAEGRVAVFTEPVWCRPCGLRECPIDHRCMRRIPASRVFEAVRAQIGAAEGAL